VRRLVGFPRRAFLDNFLFADHLPRTCSTTKRPEATALLIEVSPNVHGDALAPITIFLASAKDRPNT
jgi:hypothetical protein